MRILSPLGRCYPRLSFASTFSWGRQPSFEMISHPFTKRKVSLFLRLGRFKEFQWECPHHGIPDWLVVQTFYNGLQQPMKISIDAATGGALMAKPINEAKQLSEDMTSNNYHWGNE